MRKSRAKPKIIDSPHNDYTFAAPKAPNNYVQSSGILNVTLKQKIYETNFLTWNLTKLNSSGDTGAIHNGPAMHSRHTKPLPSNYLPLEMPEGMMMPPKFMNEYLSNLERSKGVSNPGANRRSTQKPQDGSIH